MCPYCLHTQIALASSAPAVGAGVGAGVCAGVGAGQQRDVTFYEVRIVDNSILCDEVEHDSPGLHRNRTGVGRIGLHRNCYRTVFFK